MPTAAVTTIKGIGMGISRFNEAPMPPRFAAASITFPVIATIIMG